MAEVILQFNEPLQASDGKLYVSQVCGRQAPDGGWEGWIEFTPDDDAPVLRSRRETRQSGHEDLVYWATGLTRIYLEGALERTLAPARTLEPIVPLESAYDGPAPEPSRPVQSAASTQAVLDPFSVYVKGEELLRRELGALSAWHLRNIVQAYDLFAADGAELQRLTQAELIERTVTAVRTTVDQVTQDR